MSLRDDTLDGDDLAHEAVTVKGREYHVFEATADAALDHHAEIAAETERLGGKAPRALWTLSRLIVRCVLDPETRAPIFDQPSDADRLLKKSPRLVIALGNAANRVCYIGEAEAKKIAGESNAVPSSVPSSN